MGETKRDTLTILEAKEPQKIGDKGAQKLVIKAKNKEGKDLQYFTFSNRLFSYLTQDAVIECDIDISTREYENQTYTDRKITQIYKDGQPVERKGGGGNFNNRDASIEQQVAAYIVTDLWKSSLLTKDDPLVKKMLVWIDKRLSTDKAPEPAKAPEPVKAPAPEVKKKESKPTPAKDNKSEQAVTPPPQKAPPAKPDTSPKQEEIFPAEKPAEKPKQICPMHKVPMEQRTNKDGILYWVHKVEGTEADYCNGSVVRTAKKLNKES